MISDGWHVAARAVFSGCIAVAGWPVDRLSRVLPAGLAPSDALRAGAAYPLLFLFGEQSRGAWMMGTRRFASSLAYHELLVVAPQLRCEHWSEPVATVIAAYCSFSPAVSVGRHFYGYAKDRADLGWQGGRFQVVAADAVITADVIGRPGATQDTVARLAAMTSIPIYGVRADGVGVVSAWQLEYDHARRRSVRVAMRSRTAFLGQQRWEAEGLVVESVPWTLLLPRPVSDASQRNCGSARGLV